MNHTMLAYIQDSAFIIIISYFCIKMILTCEEQHLCH